MHTQLDCNLASIRKSLSITKTLPYYGKETITAVKSFMIQATRNKIFFEIYFCGFNKNKKNFIYCLETMATYPSNI
jgi:hypothetical protein